MAKLTGTSGLCLRKPEEELNNWEARPIDFTFGETYQKGRSSDPPVSAGMDIPSDEDGLGAEAYVDPPPEPPLLFVESIVMRHFQ